MDEVLFRALAERVAGHLDAVDRLAGTCQGEVAAELYRLTDAWRAVLGLHRPIRRRCAGCRDRRGSAGMCGVWRVAVVYFVRFRA